MVLCHYLNIKISPESNKFATLVYCKHTYSVISTIFESFIPDMHCVKSVRIRSFYGSNAGKYGPEKLPIRALFMQ